MYYTSELRMLLEVVEKAIEHENVRSREIGQVVMVDGGWCKCATERARVGVERIGKIVVHEPRHARARCHTREKITIHKPREPTCSLSTAFLIPH